LELFEGEALRPEEEDDPLDRELLRELRELRELPELLDRDLLRELLPPALAPFFATALANGRAALAGTESGSPIFM
jgi:hypothetical protein